MSDDFLAFDSEAFRDNPFTTFNEHMKQVKSTFQTAMTSGGPLFDPGRTATQLDRQVAVVVPPSQETATRLLDVISKVTNGDAANVQALAMLLGGGEEENVNTATNWDQAGGTRH